MATSPMTAVFTRQGGLEGVVGYYPVAMQMHVPNKCFELSAATVAICRQAMHAQGTDQNIDKNATGGLTTSAAVNSCCGL